MTELQEIVEKINSKEVQKKDIAKELGINPSTLQRRLKKEGYSFDKETDLWIKNDSAVQTNARTNEQKIIPSNERKHDRVKEQNIKPTNEEKSKVRKRASFDIDSDLLKELKIFAITEEKNVYEVVENAIRKYLREGK